MCNNCFERFDEGLCACPACGWKESDAASEIFHLRPGTKLNKRYLIGKVLGFGGFGITYKAWDSKFESFTAVKEFFPCGVVSRAPGTRKVNLFSSAKEGEFKHGLARFLDEARSMAKFNSHRNIINVYEYFEENSTAYIVMEYLEGLTLAEFLKHNELDFHEAADIALEICKALKEIHETGIIHRDVSPDNIFLCKDQTVKLIDFGAARFSPDEEQLVTIVLKPGFAPPEQYETVNAQGPWTDIYALGATMYQMVTGIKPCESTNRKISDDLEPPSSISSEIPEYVNNAIIKAMAVDRHLRFSSAFDFEKALKRESKVLPLEWEKKKKRYVRFIQIAAAILLILYMGVELALRWSRQSDSLPNADITFWYAISGDESAVLERMNSLNSVLDEFSSSYKNVKVRAQAIPLEEYSAKIGLAASGNSLPSLFESTGAQASILRAASDLSSVVERMGLGQCIALDKYSEFYPEKKQLPLGFSAPALYVNTTLTPFYGNAVMDRDDMENLHPMAIEMQDEDDFHVSFGPELFSFEYTQNALEMFLRGDAASLYSDTSAFFQIQGAMPGKYLMLPISARQVYGKFKDLWSIGAVSGNENRAAERLLLFMLSDNAQDHLYIRNRGGALPLNSNALSAFREVHEEFDYFFLYSGESKFNAASARE
jgi:serine/threonine protein kinase